MVTSYNPDVKIQEQTLEETGANTETEKQFLYNTYTALPRDVAAHSGKSQSETYEDNAKQLFKEQPANMELLIVVDKLLTGFDAPHCTYLYIDKSMQDHGFFQAICRTNRLDGEDKAFGYVVDYKDLIKKLVNEKGTGALQVYTSELDDTPGDTTSDVLMQDRLKKKHENGWITRWRRFPCSAIRFCRQRASWNTCTILWVTLRFPTTSKLMNLSASHSTRELLPSSKPTRP